MNKQVNNSNKWIILMIIIIIKGQQQYKQW